MYRVNTPYEIAKEAQTYLQAAIDSRSGEQKLNLVVEAALKVGELKGTIQSFPLAEDHYDSLIQMVTSRLWHVVTSLSNVNLSTLSVP